MSDDRQIIESCVKEIVGTISTLEDYPAQYDVELSKETYLSMVTEILPLLMDEVPAKEIAYKMATLCPKFGG